MSMRLASVCLSRSVVGCVLGLAVTSPTISGEIPDGDRPLMRFPDIHRQTVVFVYGEDIWSVPASGGVAQRLTINDGEEWFPKFSPDGSLIAFTGEYDGNRDVYVMDPQGGNIRRVTYHPGDDIVVGWHPSQNKILFSSARKSYSRFERLFLISPDGTGLEQLILHEAVAGSFSPDATKIAYNKVSRESRTWKRYRGGTAQEIYLYDFVTNEERNLTNFEGTDRIPMWIEDRIYFSSDRDGVLNIYAYDLASGAIEQLTRHTEYDVRRPSHGESHIVYELGGSLWLLDVTTGETGRIAVEIRADAPEVRPYLKELKEFITSYDLSPSGKRALIVARGEVFTVPQEHGPTRNLTRSSGARDKDAAWSPDGSRIAFLSDQTGEYELYVVDPLGKKDAERMTSHRGGYRHTLRWSPDGKKIAFADQTLRCYYLDVETGNITEIDKADYENVDVSLDRKPISDIAWSPDSRHIAYSKMDADLVYKVYIYSLETKQKQLVSNGLFNDFGPVFSRDGEHLLFVSNRRFDPTFCDFEWEMVYKKVAGIYSLTLRKDGPALLPPRSDEERGSKHADEETKKKAPPRVEIDFDGIADRIEALPLPAGNYRDLTVSDSAVLYLDAKEGDFNRFEFRPVGPRDLYAFRFQEREAALVVEGIEGYKLSADGSHVLYKKAETLGILEWAASIGGPPASDLHGGPRSAPGAGEDTVAAQMPRPNPTMIDLSGLKMFLDPRAEWQQIFHEAWRMERDFYYEPNMHGLDWSEMKLKYGRLMPFASCRQDVRYIIGELIGELSTSHTYVFGGDRRRQADEVSVGMLGVDWEVDQAANRFRLKKIYRVPDWTRQVQPPMSRPGVDAREGDYLLRVNGLEVTAQSNVYSYFQGLAGEPTTLLINDKPTEAGAREILVEPLANEHVLRYLDWVEHNRRVAEKMSGGQIGYIHLPDTYTGSAREFPKYFYAQTRKKGLIIDGRFNGGGLDPDIFLQRLDKKVLSYWTRRYSHDQTSPAVVTRAHMVCLTNRQAGSGGDMLPMEFQMREMGPVIGTRTWGGLVGVSMWIELIDGGGLSAPDYRIYDPDGKWIVENVGVEPDIVVDLHPEEMKRGHDAQLIKAIEVLMDEIREDPRPWPQHEPFPTDPHRLQQ
ncbi:MAG: PD40 domain-containing protein [Acidobacteriota bacterium]|nr:MAG: PD40 domain-containing protein [Acidobacteriota bacterium]